MDHYSWECITIYRASYLSTIDLVIPNYRDMMALLHVLHKRVFKPIDQKFLIVYKKLKFKMKMAF